MVKNKIVSFQHAPLGGSPLSSAGDTPRRPAAGLEFLGFEKSTELELPMYLTTVAAGFPSPADDFIDAKLDLNDYLIGHPEATFFVRVYGDSMIDAGLNTDDILIVDRALEPRNNKIVIAALNGELTVKRIRKEKGKLLLVPEHPDYEPIEVTSEASFEIWGVVTYVIHKV